MSNVRNYLSHEKPILSEDLVEIAHKPSTEYKLDMTLIAVI